MFSESNLLSAQVTRLGMGQGPLWGGEGVGPGHQGSRSHDCTGRKTGAATNT